MYGPKYQRMQDVDWSDPVAPRPAALYDLTERRELVQHGRKQPPAFARPAFTGHTRPKLRHVR